MGKKTDNYNLPAKIALRRHFLLRYHACGPIHVLDCCQGGGVIWQLLRREFDVDTYWGVDVKHKKGRLKIDSTRILSQAGWPQNVIDIDTYGSPWKHWEAMLPNVRKPTTVFLTIGLVAIGDTPLTKEVKEAIGLGDLEPPRAIVASLGTLAASYLLARCYDYDIMPLEAVEAHAAASHARYIGIRLAPQNERPEDQSGRPEHPIPTTEESNA